MNTAESREMSVHNARLCSRVVGVQDWQLVKDWLNGDSWSLSSLYMSTRQLFFAVQAGSARYRLRLRRVEGSSSRPWN